MVRWCECFLLYISHLGNRMLAASTTIDCIDCDNNRLTSAARTNNLSTYASALILCIFLLLVC
jgi:hypothetical protein